MNIRVDLTTPIKDGAEVVFRSPVDCSQVTGLIVYHNEESKEFAFTDAHGNNVGDVDHLFAENVVVKVILDVAAGMAFVQNADTNAYLEQRFRDLEDQIGTGGGIAPTPDYYFDIDYDGVVSLNPDYQAGGSKNAELPEVIVIPDVIGGTAVSALAESMFESNLRVKSVTIPSWVRAIPVKFANKASNLEELNGTENIETVGKAAFQRCGIKKALFPNLKEFSGAGAFNNAANLLVANIGNANNLPDYTFYACESLSLLIGGAGITSISANGFFATRSLKNLSLLSGVNSIGASAFVLSRVDYDWWNASFTSVGANGTPAKFNPNKWWDGAMPENWNGCQNPLGSTFHQHNPEWENVQIKGSEDDTYGSGCVEVSTAHIYSALSGVTLDSPITFVEDIVGAVDNGRLLVPTGTESGKAAYTFSDMKTWLEGIGEGFECELLSWNNATLGKVYDALNEGALVLTGINPGHAGVIYGAASNGEMLVLDSSPYNRYIGIYKAETFQQPIWSFATLNSGALIVRKK